ncbi:putative arginine/serine-rich protein 1 isoform 3 [Scophthalmus maximus]|uniref:Arginine/serine-rich protein 1 n=1 Tax=Scophthalmus maximus TaxID=52904 RepID=A0A2U9CLP6_SCOMX|nr:putative arginine/serine-rich protein 1 isoform 3 [Scophthalmus maximus]
MAKGEGSHSVMARPHHSDGINVIFDQNSPASSRSRSRSSSGGSSRSSGSGRRTVLSSHGGLCKSSSSSTSSSPSSELTSRPRSRSRPRCHRRSSRCGCDSHRRNGRGRHRCSPPRRFRANSRSYSRSPSPDRCTSRRSHRSRSRSTSRRSRHRRAEDSRSTGKSYGSHSKSRSSGHSPSLSVDDKRELIGPANANALKLLVVEMPEISEGVKPAFSEQLEPKRVSPEPETWVRQDPERTTSESSDAEPDDFSNPKTSPKRKTISFSLNNSVAKPTVAAPPSAKVTPRMDSYESRKPYGHWVPIRAGKSSKARKHTLTKAH